MTNLKWLPNAVSTSRIVLSPVITLLAYQGRWLAAFVLLLIVISTDFFDGWLAKKLNACSDLGGKIDNVADLLLTASTLAGLVLAGEVSWTALLYIVPVSVMIWAGALFLPASIKLQLFFFVLLRYYYLGFVVWLIGFYAFLSLGVKAAWLLLPGIPLAAWAAIAKKHRLKPWQEV